MLKLHELKSKSRKTPDDESGFRLKRRKKKKRVGRGIGSGKGTYSGRGIKGQKSRSGYKIPAPPLFTRLPKLRGEGFRKIKREKPSVVNLKDLEEKYKDGEEVSLKSLIEKGLVDKKAKKVKILGKGKLTKRLKFADSLLFSKGVRSIIESKGKSKRKEK